MLGLPGCKEQMFSNVFSNILCTVSLCSHQVALKSLYTFKTFISGSAQGFQLYGELVSGAAYCTFVVNAGDT